MPPPTLVKGIRSFLGHAGFYRRFIKDFSKIAKSLTNLLNHDVPFSFDHACFDSFNRLKEALTTAPIMQPPDWSLPFEIMCDASDFAMGAVLGQKKEKRSYAIYYASKTLDVAQVNYATIEKEFLAVVFAVEKFRSYLIGSKEFDLQIKDKKSKDGNEEELPIGEFFLNEQLLVVVAALPWFADFVNYLSCGVLPPDLSYQQKKKFLHDVKFYTWEDPLLFKRCNDGLVRRCQRVGNVSRKNEMPQQGILEIELFDICGTDFIEPFPSSFGNKYILVGGDFQANVYAELKELMPGKLLNLIFVFHDAYSTWWSERPFELQHFEKIGEKYRNLHGNQ
ncbi:uncharacterized protein LOC131177971 [Hevea brasiliensis]|uniref:uncharacterized protein LOC131177971 n=1 Tax=Hevea brasiliensis TaxID=3981 RepID=UPI0025E16269|nr:uncharacterized protein LOC131177971 [Hevea brasiliensis]